MEEHGLQCGFCTPGMMLTARALLDAQPRPDRRRDPRGDLGPDLPLHGLHERSSGRSAGRPSTRRRGEPRRWTELMATIEEPARSASAACSARRTRASSAARATTSTTSSCPACCTAPSLRSPSRTRGSCRSTPPRPRRTRRSTPSSPARTSRRSGWRGCRRCRRHAGGARHRQGALPGPGGRVRRRRRPLLRARRARAHRRRVRGAARRSSTPARRSTPTRRSSATTRRARPTTTSSTGSPATRRRPTRSSPAPTSSSPQDMLYPRLPPGADGDVRRGRRLRPGRRQADAVEHDPGAARAPHGLRARGRAARAQDPRDLARHRRRLRQQGRRSTPATCARSSARSSPASR